MRRALRAAYWVWRRELHGMLRAPILYVVGGVFLAVQGIAFAGLVLALSDPQRVALLGELLEGQLAGTLLTWVLSLVVLTLLGMRAIADDKRSGAWELLLTAQVGEGAAVVGKWLAAATVYALLWVPTLAYLGVVAAYRADAGGWDAAAIATGYAGAIAIGAALLAWAIAASAAMASTLGAGGLSFALLILMFLAGELPALWPALAAHPAAAAVLDALSLRAAALAFARGELTARALALLGGLALTGLSLAIMLACAGRRRRRELRLRAAGTAAIAVAALGLGALAVRHPLRLDVSASRRNTLDPATREVLADVADASLTIVRPTLGAVDPIYEEVARVARRMAELAPGLAVRVVDPAAVPAGLPAIARAAGLEQARVEASGAVVVELGARRRVIDLAQIVTPARDARGQVVIAQLAIEQALAGALAALSAAAPITVCATTGHGELRLLEKDPAGLDWTFVADRLRGEGMTLEELAPGAAEVPRACRVALVAGPARPLQPAEALALQRLVHEGGGLLVAAPSRQLGEVLGKTGLEAVLAADGLGLPAAIAIDPASALRDQPGLLAITAGYADHSINAGFSGVRPTLWFQPRAVAVATERGARPLVSASSGSWGETDLFAAPEKQDQDLAGPVALAALGGKHAVIALGSAESFSTVNLANRLSATDLWLARAIRFLGGAEPRVAVAARTPDQVRLILTGGQQAAIIALSVGGIPLAWLLLGGGLVWWRRRRAERAAGGPP